mmetsp:Transcript_7219/g.8278  ORF Transcript_7219/g.8278 Transcript_7219/m.8278 type:complete len:281 (-) Transcript_7219:298-1140(-)
MSTESATKKQKVLPNEERGKLFVSLLDLTSLNEDDTEENIVDLCKKAVKAKSDIGTFPAAVCIYPKFIEVAKTTLKSLGAESVKVATVTNFPHGNPDVSQAVSETEEAVKAGADEVDVVFPYKSLMQGDESIGLEIVKQCKAACLKSPGNCILKVIIESGELKDPELITKASKICLDGGADFIKTSTGKVSVNATEDAAKLMLQTINESSEEIKKNVGFKAAGGIRDFESADSFVKIAEDVLGKDWVSPDKFRFGASSLLKNVIAYVQTGKEVSIDKTVY